MSFPQYGLKASLSDDFISWPGRSEPDIIEKQRVILAAVAVD
jgi:hypothetical protein